MPTLDQFRVLAALDAAGTFVGASKRLHRAQSAISYAVRNLERELGLQIFDRRGYRARLTAEGRAVLAKAREVLSKADELTAAAEEMRAGWEPRLTLLLDGILPVGWIVPRLKGFARSTASTELTLRVELLGGLLDALERDLPDLAIVALAAFDPPGGYHAEQIGEVMMLPVVAAEHPLAEERGPIPLDVLRRHVHLIVSDSTRHRMPLDAGLIGVPRRWNFPDFQSRLEGLRAGMGFAWMPTYLIEADVRAEKLVLLQLEERTVARSPVALLSRHTPALGRAGRLMLEVLRNPPPLVLPPAEGLLRRTKASARFGTRRKVRAKRTGIRPPGKDR